ncbi:MAG: zinc-binding dehydrogenase [Pseudomonadales bacterium]
MSSGPKLEDGVRVKVVSSSICGSDLHLMELGFLEGRTPGHEFAGYTPNGRAVAVEPVFACGSCLFCEEGQPTHCNSGTQYIGVMVDGGMAEYAIVPEQCLVEIPSGLDVSSACLVEPLAIALRGLDRVNTNDIDLRCLVIGGGPIGLAAVATAVSRGLQCDILVRYEHQAIAAETLGAKAHMAPKTLGSYKLVIDAVGSTESLQQASNRCAPLAQICMLGTAWGETKLDQGLQMKEISLITATGYRCVEPNRSFSEAANLLLKNPAIEQALISHRFPLDAAQEAFDTAADRSKGAIKIAFTM